VKTTTARTPRASKILGAVVILIALAIATALIVPTIVADNKPLTTTDIIGTWTPLDGTGTLTFNHDGTLTAEGLSVILAYGAYPAHGTFYGAGTWKIWSSRPREVSVRFTSSGETDPSRLPLDITGYPLGSTGSGDNLRLWILKDVEDDSHFEFRRAD
jgi:hypothetical protein